MENLLHPDADSGTIFDVRRFSTHDGDGIRTTVFFKGCPLSCVWCHNPEGISGKRRPLYFEKKCIHCGSCIKAANHGGVGLGAQGEILLKTDRPEDWDRIMQICPTGAIAWDSREVHVMELFREVLKDEPFFHHGGGVTLSGGEPLIQPGFAANLLALLKEQGIHTAMETALLVPERSLAMVLPHLDLIFADCKLFDEEEHIRAAGVSNRRILENIHYLLTSESRDKVVIRTPMIPGYTATEKNIADISSFLSGIYPDVRYEFLNYNPLASAKYHLVGREYCFKENPDRFTKEEMQHFAEISCRKGIKNISIDE